MFLNGVLGLGVCRASITTLLTQNFFKGVVFQSGVSGVTALYFAAVVRNQPTSRGKKLLGAGFVVCLNIVMALNSKVTCAVPVFFSIIAICYKRQQRAALSGKVFQGDILDLIANFLPAEERVFFLHQRIVTKLLVLVVYGSYKKL